MIRRIALAICLVACPAFADDKYAAPDLSEYYASLRMPDYPQSSCCGAGDAWEANQSELDAAGNLVVTITDTRPDTRRLPDGTVIARRHIKPGTKFTVPPSKIRKHPIPNPTDNTIVFIGYNDQVLCYEPVSGI